jgi:hypothetical protein
VPDDRHETRASERLGRGWKTERWEPELQRDLAAIRSGLFPAGDDGNADSATKKGESADRSAASHLIPDPMADRAALSALRGTSHAISAISRACARVYHRESAVIGSGKAQ